MPTLAEQLNISDDPNVNPTQLSDAENNNDVSTIASILAGVGSGLIKIPEGVVSLGATIMDLGGDSNYAAQVEKWFDDINPFDEMAEATTAGKLVETFTNLAVPGGIAFKAGSKIAKTALSAKKAGKYFQLNNPNLVKGAQKAIELNKKGKAAQFVAGSTAGGLAEGVFVADVEEAGTFGDLLGGPTELERDNEYDPEREIINRIKFGTEGALFTGVIGGAGSTIKKLATRGKDLRFSNNSIDRLLDKAASKLRARGGKTQEFFDLERQQLGKRAADVNFAQNVARELDKNIDAIFPPTKTILNKQTAKQRTDTLKTLNDLLLSGKPVVNEAGNVVFGNVDKKIKDQLMTEFKRVGGKKENIDAIFNNIDSIRNGWGEMFSALGSKLQGAKLNQFKDLFGKKFQNYLGSTYDLFQNKSLIPYLNYKPAEEAVNAAKKMFKSVAAQNGKKLTDEQANYYVERLVKTARLPKGFRMDKPSDPVFQIPDFFVGKTVLDDAVTDRGFTSLAMLPKAEREVIEELLGRTKNPMQTILGGTGRLSLVTRRNEFFQDLVQKSNELSKSGKRGMIYETEEEALQALGPDIKKINIDPGKTLEAGITNPVNGKWAINEVADALELTAKQSRSDSIVGKLYENLVLYPKATSQIAKTILSPITHARNFISAGAFATANGIIPTPGAMKDAYQALQVGLKGTRQQNELYRKLLKLGVVNSNVKLGDLRKLMEDVRFGETLTSDKGLRALLKPLSKIKSFAEDAYTAEDDFWKITSWAVERDRLGKAYLKAGVKRTASELDEEAANIVRNNIPNYDYVSEFVKGLRKLPFGNFVSFPAEIMRTSTNIVKRALDEINYTVKVGGKEVKPLAGIGYKRLIGMATTTAAVPYATTEVAKSLYNVTEDEMNALRRYVADWSKNSVLIPFKDDDGNMQYIDFSHLNAYDTLTRPIQTVLNKIEDGRADEDGIIDDAVLGLIESTKELLSPFVSESIWTEALQDVAPILGRDGTDSEGRRVWNPEDSIGDKLYKAVAHLVEAQAPLNWRQLERLGISMLPVDSKGSFDERGNQYELGNEALGIAGLRRVDVDPKKSFNYKITEYKTGVRNSRNLFTAATLKGGMVTPKEIVDAYINANRALYNVNRSLYEDIKAAKILGTSEDFLYERMDGRGEKKAFNAINDGEFRPLTLSKDLQELFQIRAQELGVANPYSQAENIIDRIQEVLSRAPLSGDLFPEIENPLDTSMVEGISDVIGNIQLPTTTGGDLLTANAPGFTGQGNINTNAAQAAFYQAQYPNDEIGNLYNLKKNQTKLG